MVYSIVSDICEKNGISIKELEKKAGLSNGTIGKWRQSEPKFYGIIRVANALGITTDDLAKGYSESEEVRSEDQLDDGSST